MAKKTKFPKELFVQIQEDSDSYYFTTDTDVNALDEENGDGDVAIYILKEVKKLKIDRKLV